VSVMLDKERHNGKEININRSAFLVYTFLYLHYNESIGVRQVQRALGFSSPSSAIFQLEKLRELGLAQKQRNGKYSLLKRQKIGILRNFVIIHGVLIPWMLVYAFTISLLTTIFLLLFIRYGTLMIILATIPSIIASYVMWIEAYKIWKSRPKFLKD
jgi:cellulose synthase/poly-beta-1,6-N-acetylglucosamine synthase-like glycosyltransferase